MLGSIHDVSIQQVDIEELRMRLLTMPAHPDVPAGLKQLKDVGFRLVTLTNSPPDPQTSPLKHAGIDGWFEESFSVDRVRRFKPAPQIYHMVAEELDVPPAAILHGGGARVGYERGAKHRLLGSAHYQDPAMLLWPYVACRSRRRLRRTFQAWPGNSSSSGVDAVTESLICDCVSVRGAALIGVLASDGL